MKNLHLSPLGLVVTVSAAAPNAAHARVGLFKGLITAIRVNQLSEGVSRASKNYDQAITTQNALLDSWNANCRGRTYFQPDLAPAETLSWSL